MEKYLRRSNRLVAERIHALRRQVAHEFGWLSRASALALGPALLLAARREQKRLAAGHTYEPPTVIERRNWTFPEVRLDLIPTLLPAPEESLGA
jgi:hypothetical protein